MEDPENESRERVNAYYLAFIMLKGLVFTRRREKRDRKIVEVIC